MAKEFKMSQARYDELKQELDYSKTTRADEVAELIKEARGFGDLSENSEYDEAKNEQGKLYSRIAELEDILLHAVIVDETEESDKITIGSVVTVTELAGGKQLPVYRIVGSQEADVMSRAVSEDSPFGKALMGHKAGEEVAVEAPRGVIRYRIDKIERCTQGAQCVRMGNIQRRAAKWQTKPTATRHSSRTWVNCCASAVRSSRPCRMRAATPSRSQNST